MASTPIFSQGVKFIKIARIDDQGNDNTLSLQELNTVRVKFSDVGVVDYPITSIAKYDDYFLFGVAATNRTSSTDNEILNYRASGSKIYVVGGQTDDGIITNYTEAYDNLGYFNPTTGKYTLGNTPNIPIRLTISSSITGSTSGNVVIFINSSVQGIVASSSVALGSSPPYRQVLNSSYNGITQENEQFYITITNTSLNNINFTGSFFVTQSTNPVAGISDLVVLEPFIDADFATSDYNVLAGNAIEPRVNPFYMDADYSTDALQAVNIDQILAGTATRATVQPSNYTYGSQISGRYIGQQLNGIDINVYTPSTEYTGSTPGSKSSGSFILSTNLIDADVIQINYAANQYNFVASGSIGDIPSDNPPLYYFPTQSTISNTATVVAAKINGALSGSTATSLNLLKATANGTSLSFTSSFIGEIYNDINIFTGSYGYDPLYRVLTLQNGSDPTLITSIYGFTGSWPGDISYGKDPVINLYDSCIYEFSKAVSGYPVIENGGTITLDNVYLIGDTVDSVNTIDYVDPSYSGLIERNLAVGTSIYQQQYVNSNLLPVELNVTLNGIGVNQSSYFIPTTFTSSYTDVTPQSSVPGIIRIYGSGSPSDPTFNVPFVDFQFSPGGANPKILGFPTTTTDNITNFQQTGSFTFGDIMGSAISSSINEGNRWFISFYDNLGNIADGRGLNQLGPPVEITAVTYITASNTVSGHYNLILNSTPSSLANQLNTTSSIASIGGKGTPIVTGSGYGVLIWQGQQAPNLITNIGSTSNLYNDVTAGYILLNPVRPFIKNNVNFITKRYGKNTGTI